MIFTCEAKVVKAACEFVTPGVDGVKLIQIRANKDTGRTAFTIDGLAEYSAEIVCQSVALTGDCAVSAKVFTELISKIKHPAATAFRFVLAGEKLMISGPQIAYSLPAVLGYQGVGNVKGSALMQVSIVPVALGQIVSCMKAIKDAESDTDMPACELRVDGGMLQFVAITRYRSVSTWVRDSRVKGIGISDEIAKQGYSTYLAIDHLKSMDKACKGVKDSVLLYFYSNMVKFVFDAGRVISLRVLEKSASKIHELIKHTLAPENIRRVFTVDGKMLKEAYDRLDAFGKRNTTSIHRLDFVVGNDSLRIQAHGSSVGSGSEVMGIDNPAGFEPGRESVTFAANGNKLADLLRVSGYQKVEVLVGGRNICLRWSGAHEDNIAILAGLATEERGYE